MTEIIPELQILSDLDSDEHSVMMYVKIIFLKTNLKFSK